MTLLSALCCPLQTPAKADALVPAEVVQWTQSHVYPLHVSTADSSFGLAPLAHVLGHARVIGLGEADHGLHEFFAFRNLFFQYGVEKLGVTAIAAETGVTESFAADDYVLGRRGFDRAVADSVFSWSAVAYEENRALLDWMRSYNALPSTTRKLHFYGIDLTGGRGGRFVEARLSLDAALDYAAPLEATQIASIRSRVAPLEARFATGAYDSLSAEQQATLTTAIDDLVSLIERRSAVWPARTSGVPTSGIVTILPHP